jgi:ribosomal protein S18 acetylase RimI-like enzyme
VLELRPATLDDVTEAAELMAARERADWGEWSFTAEQLRSWWAEEPAAERWLAWLDGRCAGYAQLFDDGAELAEIHDESCTHPELEGRGVATALFDCLEALAREKTFGGIRATGWTDRGRAFLTGRGYGFAESFWRMETDLGEAPPPEVPAGYRLDDYCEHEDDEALYACALRAGGDWVGGTSLGLWTRHRHSRPDYDPRGWAIARAGDEVAGAALGFPLEGRAWILDVFVAPEHQGHGLGLALLRDCFRRLREVGCTHVGLEVEAENAIRLYERAGMRVTRRYDVHEKPL